MSVFHDEVEIEDFEFDEDTERTLSSTRTRRHGDILLLPMAMSLRTVRRQVRQEDLENGEEVATCPSCSLIVKVIYDKEEFMTGEMVEAPSSTETKLEVAQA